jgi:hypothetical protein
MIRFGFLFIEDDLAILINFLGLSRYGGGAEYGKTMQLVTAIAYPASQSQASPNVGHVLL